jgi:hypothetical protein
MNEEKYIKGTPSAVLLPAKNYFFRVGNEYYEITLPRSGSYNDIAPEIFGEDAGEFNLLIEENGILFLPAITKVLFATGKYPDLKFNQFFVITTINFGEDEVSIIGQVIDLVIPVDENNEIVKEG